MTTSPCTPEEFWADDETPHTGHPGTDLSDDGDRTVFEPTNVYIRRLVTERNEARAQSKRLATQNVEFAGEIARLTKPKRVRPCGPNCGWDCEHEPVENPKGCFCGGEHHA